MTATQTERTKVQARYLAAGDRTGSGETVVSVASGLHTPRGKVEVTLEKDGRRRMSLWGANTVICITRPAPAPFTYMDLLNSDGTRNVRAFAAILDGKITAEINLRLCASVELRAPRELSLGDVPAWRAEQVKALGLGPVSKDERDRIGRQELIELEHWLRVAQQAAGKQRDAMNAAFALAAE